MESHSRSCKTACPLSCSGETPCLIEKRPGQTASAQLCLVHVVPRRSSAAASRPTGMVCCPQPRGSMPDFVISGGMPFGQRGPRHSALELT